MNENENNYNFDGFDSTSPAPEQPKNDNPTVTPEDGYYESPLNTPPKNEQKSDYIPTGDYKAGEYHYSYVSPQANTPKVSSPKEPKKYGIGALIATALIAAIVSSGCFWMLSQTNTPLTQNNAEGNTSSKVTEKVVKINGSIEQIAQSAASKAGDSVVGVQTTFAVQNFFSGESTESGSGSGVIYKQDGYILTNYHVIAETLNSSNSKITVFLDNNTEKGYEAKLINYNMSCDLAVLKINKTGLNAIEIGNSDKLKVGQYVIAIGSPAGLNFMGSTTFGIISGLDRKLSTTSGTMSLIQTDAAINPGNSGGALVNTKGQLVGISNSKLVNTSYEGMGFAIPVNKVVEICDSLIAHQNDGDPYTGISISTNYTADVLSYYGYPEGAVVDGVDAGSPADKGGIKRGDIIIKFGDTKLTEYTDYDSALKNYFPGDKVKVTYYRSGRNVTTSITIGSAN